MSKQDEYDKYVQQVEADNLQRDMFDGDTESVYEDVMTYEEWLSEQDVSDETITNTLDEHIQVVQATIYEIIAMRQRLADYINKFELINILTREEVEFLNKVAIEGQALIDGRSHQ